MATNADDPARGPESIGPRRLSANEQAIAAELRYLDPHLAGLFERGLGLADEIDEPGVRYLVAHVGRELSRAIVTLLTGETTVQRDSADEDEEREDRFREKIAGVLDLPENHPNVAAWFRSHKALVAGVHWRNPPASAATVRESFVTLIGLLFGRIAPYFDTQSELDRLLSVREPTAGDVAHLQRCTVRYTQRRYFFSRLAETHWLAPLAAAGFFRNPPDRVEHADGSWSIQQWPEGEALARLGCDAPEITIRELTSLPRKHQNPAVWDVVAQAARTLAPREAAHLVPMLVHALKAAPPVLFPRTIIDVITHLADGGCVDQAFDLTAALLLVRSAQPRRTAPSQPEIE